MLGERMRTLDHQGYHIWLPMPKDDAHRLEQAARALGILITPPSSTAANPESLESGVRLRLGAPSIAELNLVLSSIAKIQFDGQEPSTRLAF